MKEIILEDQGTIELIDRAVYATIAVLIKYHGLTSEALAISSNNRNTEISQGLVNQWKFGQKIRKFLENRL